MKKLIFRCSDVCLPARLLIAPSLRRIKAPSLKTYLSSLHSFFLSAFQVTVTETSRQAHQSFLPSAASSTRSAPSKTLRAFLESVVPPGCLWSAPASRHSQPCLEHLQAKVPGGAASSLNMEKQQLPAAEPQPVVSHFCRQTVAGQIDKHYGPVI